MRGGLTVEGCKWIDTSKLKKLGYLEKNYYAGLLTWYSNGEEWGSVRAEVDAENTYLRLQYTQTDYWSGEKKGYDYHVLLSNSSCNYGGVRYWLHCSYCGKRVKKLYLRNGRELGCRKCLHLAYTSQNIGGRKKRFGKIITYYELQDELETIRKYYKGKETRRYRRWLYYQNKLDRALGCWVNKL
ncbi:hypothetical protein K9L27_01920 [Candidatus Gracilibacteria bacterium]|nr:hypothetical protein [Candidatus Gracilibacteria bacterium]